MENEKELKEISEEATPAEELSAEAEAPVEAEIAEEAAAQEPVEEAACTEEEACAEEAASGEEEAPVAEETPVEEKKNVTPGKLALVIAGIVVVMAVIVALLAGGKAETSADPALESVQPVGTVPADGNPDDYTCKGSYTVSDKEAKKAADKVVAVIGSHELTNGQLQALYWMQVQSFLSSEYGSYMQYYGVLDYTQPLDTQLSPMIENGTWQQFLLKETLATWRNYCALADNAEKAQLTISEENQEFLDNIAQSLETSADQYGLASGEELLTKLVGPGASVEDYRYCQELLMKGNLYYDTESAKLDATEEEIEAFFAEHEAEYTESGITKENEYVDVRHILVMPEGGTTDATGATVYSEEEWEACRVKAEEVLEQWKKDPTEDKFAELAAVVTQDPGSKENGGLYERVYIGQMVSEFEDWCFDKSRQTGDSGIVRTTYGYHVMYFVKGYVEENPNWLEYVKQDVITEKTNMMMDALLLAYPMEVSYEDIVLGYVNLAGE